MKIYRTTARLETPAAISIRRATGNDLNTSLYLPGSTIRGALAATYLEQGGSAADALFEGVFTAAKVHFGDLRIDGARRWPLSARRCAGNDNHTLDDLLLKMGAQQYDPSLKIRLQCGSVIPASSETPSEPCSAKRKYPDGFYLQDPDTGHHLGQEVGSRRVAHSEIDGALLRARNGQFHSTRVLNRRQIFHGRVYVEDDAVASLCELLGAPREIYIGRGRTRGQGRVTLSLSQDGGTEIVEMRNRIADFNRKAGNRFPALRDAVLFSCTLQSATILLDNWLCSKGAPDEADLNLEPESYSRIAALCRPSNIAGWHSAAGLPKADANAISAGSCFLFASRNANREQEYDRLARILAPLEDSGIGERREEGFGEAIFCLPFHLERAEV